MLTSMPMVCLLSALPLAGAVDYSTVGNLLQGHPLLAAAHLNSGESAGSSSNRFIAYS